MHENRCALCNAPLRDGATGCEYCGGRTRGGSGASGAKAKNDAPRRFSPGRILTFILGGVGLLCCTPCGLFGALYETVYAVRMETPKYDPHAVPHEQRRAEPIEPVQVFREMADAGGHSLDHRKQEWRAKYQGRWVTWTGRVKDTLILEKGNSELRLRPVAGTEYEVQVFLGPYQNEALRSLRKDQEVRVSGMLWGYYFIGDTVRLADGVLMGRFASEQAP